MIIINPDGTVEPMRIGPVDVHVHQDAAAVSPRSAWLARAYVPGHPVYIAHGWGSMPDDAVREVQDRLVELRDALVLACMDVASLPGCGGEEMMGLEADEEAA